MLGVQNYDRPFQPNDIRDCVLAFHASDGIEFEPGASTIRSWADQSGSRAVANQVFATETNTAKQPSYVSDGTETRLVFDGSNDKLELHTGSATGSDAEITLDTSNGGWTVISIFTSDDWMSDNQAIVGDPDDTQNFIHKNDTGASIWKIKVNTNLKQINTNNPSSFTNGRYYCFMFTCNSSGTITMFVDGVPQTDTETINATDDLKIESIAARGGTQHLDGNIKHIIVYDRELNTEEKSLIKEWMAQYIG
tara:strand:+ start:680 stop:1432 length:753 start_codon:yes stop_codon:yes gene_type:complete